jgi:dihydroxy-acid dehydratase
VADGDLIEIDLTANRLNIVGVSDEPKDEAAVAEILAARLATFVPPQPERKPGLLGMYQQLAVSAAQGGGLRV